MKNLIKHILIYSLTLCSPPAFSSSTDMKKNDLIAHIQTASTAGFIIGGSLGVLDILKPLWMGPLQARKHIYMHNNMLLWHKALNWAPFLLGDHMGLALATGPGSFMMRALGNVKPGILGLQSLTAANLFHSSFYIASLAIDTAILGGLAGGALWASKQTIKKVKQHWLSPKKTTGNFDL